MVSDETWEKYRAILRNFHDAAMKEDIVWKRTISSRTILSNETKTVDINLEGLVQYNYFRNWPINDMTTSGEIDKESVLLYLNQRYLEEQGYLTVEKQFDFDPGYDRFIIEGIKYKPAGDSKAGQAKDETILVFIILQREELNNTDNVK